MKTIFVSTIVVAMLAAHNAQAADTGQQLGLAGAALAGAAAGGPIGLIVGATLANHYVNQRAGRDDALRHASALDAQLRAAEADLTTGQQEAARLAAELQRLQRDNAQLAEDRALLGELQFDIHFRTADSTLSEADTVRLVRMAEFLHRHPELRVELHGHADARGADEINDRLALARANAVAAVLCGLDIDASRIAAFAHGERQASASDSDTDGLAYDRRVRVALDGGGLSAGPAVAEGGATAAVAAAASASVAPATLRLKISSRTDSSGGAEAGAVTPAD